MRKIESNPDRQNYLCSQEKKYPIDSWHLKARGGDGDRVLLRYSVRRINRGEKIDDPYWFWLSKRGDQNWEVTGYEVWY
jgi:hypothetical protein